MNTNQCRPVVIALFAVCACSPVAAMERSAIEGSVTAPRGRPLDSAALHRGDQADDPAHIDRLRMAADAGCDDAALQTLTAIAGAGNVAAQRAVGTTLLARGDARSAAEGRRWLMRAAAQGDGLSALHLGRVWLRDSPAATRNEARARDWLHKAYGREVTRAQAAYYLGLLARANDPAQAVAYFREAAEQGIAEAMYLLGNASAAGDGTDQDPREAMRWYLRAAALDHPAAIQELAFAFQRGDTLLPQSDLQAANMRLAMEHALRHPKAAP